MVDLVAGVTDDPSMDDDAMDSREAARNRRRDRDASAEARDLLKPGMGKVFKQIQDAQRRAAKGDAGVARPPGGRGARNSRGQPTP